MTKHHAECQCGQLTVDASADPIFDDLAIAGDGVLSTNTRMTNGMCRLGAAGDWIGVGNTATSTSRRPWVRRVTTGGSVTYTNVNVGTFPSESWLHDATYDGVNVYAVGGLAAGNVRRIYRIDPADGSVSATIAVSGLPSMS